MYRWGLGDITCPVPASMNPYDPSAGFPLPEVCSPLDPACVGRNSALDLQKQNQHQAYMDALAACGARSSGGPIVQAAFTPGAQADFAALPPPVAIVTYTQPPANPIVTVSSPAASKPVDPLSTMSAAVPPIKAQQPIDYSMSTQADSTQQDTTVSTGFDFSSIPWWGWVGAAGLGLWAMSGKH